MFLTEQQVKCKSIKCNTSNALYVLVVKYSENNRVVTVYLPETVDIHGILWDHTLHVPDS